ncbi:MAG: diguanylate cyclase [Isosphaeraceae bacterium]
MRDGEWGRSTRWQRGRSGRSCGTRRPSWSGRLEGFGADTTFGFSCGSTALARRAGSAGGAELAARLSAASLVRCRRAVAEVLAGAPSRHTRLVFLADGRGVAYRALLTPGGGGSVWLLAEPARARPGRDARLREALKEARTDPLTGLANRRQADAWLHSAVRRAERRGEPLSCLVVDLDRFKG